MGDMENKAEETAEQPETPAEPEAPEEAAPPEGEEAPEEVEAKAEEEGSEADDEGEEEEPKPDEPAKAEGKHKRKTGFQRRIERLERSLEEKDALLSRVLTGQQQPPAEQPKLTPEEEAAGRIQALINQGVQRALTVERQAAAVSQLEQKWEADMQAEEDEGYESRRFLNQVRTQLAPGPVKEALLTSEYAPKIISSLLRNPQELARLSALPEGQAAREIGRLEAKYAAGTAPVAPKTKPAIRPPAPPTNVSGSTSSTRSLEDLPLSDYKRAYRSGRR